MNLVTILILTAVAAAISLESVHVWSHLSLFHEQMAYQIARKASRKPLQMLCTVRGLFLMLELAFTCVTARFLYRYVNAWRVFVRELLPIFLIALGLSAYAVFGRELPYNLYTYAIVPATFCCLTYRLLSLLDTSQTDVLVSESAAT